jgi:hypothetical protein
MLPVAKGRREYIDDGKVDGRASEGKEIYPDGGLSVHPHGFGDNTAKAVR